MCNFFITADPILYESRTRTVRIHGVSTSIRLENFIWDTLAALAAEENVSTNALIMSFHDEIMRHRGDVLNFTSFLRVTCLRYLKRRCDRLEADVAAAPLTGKVAGNGTAVSTPVSPHSLTTH